MQLEPNKIEAFLTFDDDVIAINLAIKSKVDEIVSNLGEVDKARVLFEWVRDEIPHTKDIGAEVVTCSAIDAFTKGTGICFPKAHLLASMMRYAGIPCGFCYQVFQNDLAPEGQKNALHGLNAIYLKTTGKWHRIDPRGNRDDIHAEFSIDEEILAFPEMKFLDDVIYASPLKKVVNGLNKAESISALWPRLPSTLIDNE